VAPLNPVAPVAPGLTPVSKLPLPMKYGAVMLPVTERLANVPTVVKLLNNTLLLNVLPVIFAALLLVTIPVNKLPLPKT
jgi:hypothetical protein